MGNVLIGKRIIIIGSSGSGKTTLSMQLSEKRKLPLIHLDKEYWQPGWVQPPKEEWRTKQQKLVSGESWIIDGNYGGSLDIRLEKADTVIFLDYNRYLCLYRVLKRWISNIGKTRIDMADGCMEKIDFPFLKFVWRFPKEARCNIINKLIEYKNINVLIFRSTKETRQFLNSLR